jgi:hypothetical protein
MKKESTPIQIFSYRPTRLDYFAAAALRGLVSGRSEKNLSRYVRMALELAREMEKQIDSQENN